MCDSLFKNKKFTYIYPTALVLLAVLIIIFNQEVNGAVFFVLVVSAALVMSSRLTDAMLPAMLLAVFVTRCYNSADTFLAKAWAAIPPVIAVIYHFVKYRKPIRIGKSFYGICAVTVSVTLGGLGTIPVSDYFYPTALFYVFGLGAGMAVFYLLVKSQLTKDAPHEIAKIMYITGLLACFCVIRFYIDGIDEFHATNEFLYFRSSNNLATFLMLAMPFPLYYTSRRHGDILSVCLMYVCTVFTGSRGGILMGSIEFLILLVVWAFMSCKKNVKILVCGALALCLIVGLVFWIPYVAELCGVTFSEDGEDLSFVEYIYKICEIFFDSTRTDLLYRMIEDFKTNPLFGVGIGYTGNSDIYNPVKGAMNWYHMWFAQVIGGLGLLGVAAYGYQCVGRIIIYIKNRGHLNFLYLLSYFGLFLMSQVNPGEFCPMPYAALAVTYFLMMEDGDPLTEGKPWTLKKSRTDAPAEEKETETLSV